MTAKGVEAHPVGRPRPRVTPLRASRCMVNGRSVARGGRSRTMPLLQVLRNDLALNGPEVRLRARRNAAPARCWVDGVAARSCCVTPAHGVAARASHHARRTGSTRGKLASGAAGLSKTRRPRNAATASTAW